MGGFLKKYDLDRGMVKLEKKLTVNSNQDRSYGILHFVALCQSKLKSFTKLSYNNLIFLKLGLN